MKIKKIVHSTSGSRLKQRLHIKQFPDKEAGHTFLNKQTNNDWQEYDGELTKGIYAFAGGKWHNVKSLDSSVLAHI